jgi:hypothetical protein
MGFANVFIRCNLFDMHVKGGNKKIWHEMITHYYKMSMRFISPRSLDQWIHSKSSEITWRAKTHFVVVIFVCDSKNYVIMNKYNIISTF